MIIGFLVFVVFFFPSEHKSLFILIWLCFMKRHVWRVNYFSSKHKSLFMKMYVYFMKRHVWRVSYFFIKRLTKIETFSTFLNNHQKILENSRKFRFLNFHLENSRTWIFTLWNHILQTQTSLLQHILVYIYINNNVCICDLRSI